MVKFPCGRCGARLQADDELVHVPGQCPACGVEFLVPATRQYLAKVATIKRAARVKEARLTAKTERRATVAARAVARRERCARAAEATRRAAQSFFGRRLHLVPCLIAMAFLLGALGHWPYAYYKILRWVTCAAAILVAYLACEYEQRWAAWLFGAVAILFNPLLPVHLTRDIWRPIDVITAVLFFLAAIFIAEPRPKQESETEPPP